MTDSSPDQENALPSKIPTQGFIFMITLPFPSLPSPLLFFPLLSSPFLLLHTSDPKRRSNISISSSISSIYSQQLAPSVDTCSQPQFLADSEYVGVLYCPRK